MINIVVKIYKYDLFDPYLYRSC